MNHIKSPNLTIISGSHRLQSNTIKIAEHTTNMLKNKRNTDPQLINLAKENLPLWDESLWDKDKETFKSQWNPISATLKNSDGFIIITPEWHGMVPAALKNFFLFCSTKELGHKPAFIISVSAGLGGSYPIVELRSSSYKNNRICYLPEHLIIRNANEYFNTPEPQSTHEKNLHNRLEQSLDLLTNYSLALTEVRKQMKFDFDTFANGM
jgi:NAD(P)H-dependent FMN reductase